MVRAELIYNPYLLETEVRFNGNPPRINSLVEKYKGEKLQTWISEIPSIFYDEMNGYDFELEFLLQQQLRAYLPIISGARMLDDYLDYLFH